MVDMISSALLTFLQDRRI